MTETGRGWDGIGDKTRQRVSVTVYATTSVVADTGTLDALGGATYVYTDVGTDGRRGVGPDDVSISEPTGPE